MGPKQVLPFRTRVKHFLKNDVDDLFEGCVNIDVMKTKFFAWNTLFAISLKQEKNICRFDALVEHKPVDYLPDKMK